MAQGVYAGPEMALWRRLVLRHAGAVARVLACVWVGLLAAGVVAGWRPPRGVTAAVFGLLAVMVCLAIWAGRERERLVREAPLPRFLLRKLRDTYPHLGAKDAELVERGLRQFFLACLRSRRKFVAMPSKVVDSMWHEFILHTRAYRAWCELAIGRFVDHVPAEALGPRTATNDGLRRAWYWACRDEAIRPRKPSRLPLLFALDAKLAIAGGFVYAANCSALAPEAVAAGVYCGESFGDGSYSGDGDSFGGSTDDGAGHGGSSSGAGSSGGDGDGSSSSSGDSGCGSGGCGGGGD